MTLAGLTGLSEGLFTSYLDRFLEGNLMNLQGSNFAGSNSTLPAVNVKANNIIPNSIIPKGIKSNIESKRLFENSIFRFQL